MAGLLVFGGTAALVTRAVNDKSPPVPVQKSPLETMPPTRQTPPMQIDTEATRHLQRAAHAAREASRVLAGTSEAQRDTALRIMATSLRGHREPILTANAADLAAFKG